MNGQICRMLCGLTLFLAANMTARGDELSVPSGFVSEMLTHVPAPAPASDAEADEKHAEMIAAGFTGMWMPVVLVYSRDGRLLQAYNGPLDKFLETPLSVGLLDEPIVDGMNALLKKIGKHHADTFALASEDDYLILLLSPKAMHSACPSCKFAHAETEQALAAHGIAARVVDVDLSLE